MEAFNPRLTPKSPTSPYYMGGGEQMIVKIMAIITVFIFLLCAIAPMCQEWLDEWERKHGNKTL